MKFSTVVYSRKRKNKFITGKIHIYVQFFFHSHNAFSTEQQYFKKVMITYLPNASTIINSVGFCFPSPSTTITIIIIICNVLHSISYTSLLRLLAHLKQNEIKALQGIYTHMFSDCIEGRRRLIIDEYQRVFEDRSRYWHSLLLTTWPTTAHTLLSTHPIS